MPVVRGMFGAPVFLAEAPDIIGNQERLSAINQKQQALDMEGERQQSLAANRQTLSGIKQQNALNGRLSALVQMAPDNPDLATKMLNEDQELQKAFNITPGQFKFEGRKGKATVVRDLYGGRTLLIDPYAKDPSKAIIADVETARPPATEGQVKGQILAGMSPEDQAAVVKGEKKGGSTRARTKAELAQAAIAGDEEAAQILAEIGGLPGLVGALTRRAAGAGVTDPSVKGLDSNEAKRRLAELGKLDAVKALVGSALLGGGAGGGAPGGGEGGGPRNIRNPETGEEGELDPGTPLPDGWEFDD